MFNYHFPNFDIVIITTYINKKLIKPLTGEIVHTGILERAFSVFFVWYLIVSKNKIM